MRFDLPAPVFQTPEREQTPGIWMSHSDARTSVMMQVPSVGAFVRALLPVRLTTGFTVTFGGWLGVHPDDLQRAFRVWWEPGYADLGLDGLPANALPGWGLLGAATHAEVRDPEQTPLSRTRVAAGRPSCALRQARGSSSKPLHALESSCCRAEPGLTSTGSVGVGA